MTDLFVNPLIGWRVWTLSFQGLHSYFVNEFWPHRQALQAFHRMYGIEQLEDWSRHSDAPMIGCRCGIYASKFPLVWNGQPHGEVYLWGRVLEHDGGYKAQYAYPKSLFLPRDYRTFMGNFINKGSHDSAATYIDLPTRKEYDWAGLVRQAYDIPVYKNRMGIGMEISDLMVERIYRALIEATLQPGAHAWVTALDVFHQMPARSDITEEIVEHGLRTLFARDRVEWRPRENDYPDRYKVIHIRNDDSVVGGA